MDSEVYGYETSNKMMIVCNTGSSNQIMIQEGNKITEYIYSN
jgi:cellobiose-specific phosphotransferase system component IIB